ncbi:LOW QUALITY PROTEIN: uncharacterized protein RCH25_025400 [Pelodytes ibericus]
MAASGSLSWMEKTRDEIQKLQEWKDFTAKLCDAVQQQMNESNVNTFTDLSESEKVFVLEKAAKALNAGDIYTKLSAHISSCLEDNLYNYAARELQDSDIPKNQSDLVVKHIQDGVITILEKRPELKTKLHVLFNQPLPVSLRTLTWRLQLSNTKARMDYLTQQSMNKARSVLDGEILLQCQALLSQEQTFQHFRDKKNLERMMRNVLSYYHKCKNLKGHLPEADYLLLLPLVQAVMDTSNPSTSLSSMSALLVEEYITFMDSRPSAIQDPTSDDLIFQETAQLLNKLDPILARTMQTIYTSQGSHSNSRKREALLSGIHKMMLPVVQVLFVGYLNMNTLMYVWDQYIIGLDQPSYNCLPAICVAFIILLRGHLTSCSSHHEIEAVFKTQGSTLSVEEFQTIINTHFYPELFGLLTKGESSLYPVHDPTQATPQWSHLSRVTIPQRITPQGRRKAREEQEMLKRQTAERQQKEEQMRLLQEELQRRQEEARLNMLLEDTKRTYEVEKSHLENQLKQEQQESYEMKKKAEKQISELQDEIRRLTQQRRESVGGYSVESILAPPPSVNSHTSNRSGSSNLPKTPEQKAVPSSMTPIKEVNGRTASIVVLDLLKAVMESADSIINGRNIAERDTLNGMTREHLRNYKEDIKSAQIEIFGHELEPDELDNIKEPKKTTLAKKLSMVIRRKSEARYTASSKAEEKRLTDTVTYTNTL